MKALLGIAGVAVGVAIALPGAAQSPGAFSTLSATGTATLGGDVLMCSGRPWIDVRCNGAQGDDSHDDADAVQTTIDQAIANDWPVYFSAGTYKVGSRLTIDYAGEAAKGFRLISDGATIDGRGISAGPVLQIRCGGGTADAPADCFYFKEEGSLFVNGAAPGYAVVFGNPDFSDAQNSVKIDHLIVNNASSDPAAGGCQFNYVLDADIDAICDSAGGAAGIALEQVQFSRISGGGSAAAPGGRGLVLENGYDFSNTFLALDLEASPICLSITFDHNGLNTFISPYFNCVTAINATASLGNLLINPNYGGAVVNYGALATGIRVLGTGSRAKWLFPSAAAYTASPVDDGLSVSSFNAPGSSMTVTLPPIAAVGAGWSMSFASDNGKGMTIAAPSGAILAGGKVSPSISLGPGDYENLRLESDGNNWRVIDATRSTRLANGFEPPPWPSNWLYPSAPGYAATLADNGNTLSSFDTPAGLTVTLPPTTGLPNGWSMGFATDNAKPLTVQVNAASGGHILFPGSGGVQNSVTMASGFPGQDAYEYMVLQYDSSGGTGNFRIVSATPATIAALDALGTGGAIRRWSFPSGSTAYAATAADNGNMISSFNSPSSFMAVTLPPTTAINPGWTIGLSGDNGKAMSVQVDGTNGGQILLPGSQGAVTSLGLPRDYENAILQFDGSNFRVLHMTPGAADALGMAVQIGTPASSSAPCFISEIEQDSNYIYICTAPNTWKRAALSAF